MAEIWESVGEYTYRSYTKIDVWELGEQKDIDIHAIHEFVHAYMTKLSNYGTYLMAFSAVLKNHSDYRNHFSGVEKDEFNTKMKRLEKIFLALNDNMKNMQETVATTVEILYMCYLDGYEGVDTYISKLGNYAKYVKPFEFIFNEKYLHELEKCYYSYLKTFSPLFYDVYSNNTENRREIFSAILLFLEMGVTALNIEKLDCSDKKWLYPNSLVNTDLVGMKYNPDKRFEEIITQVICMDLTYTNFDVLHEKADKLSIDVVKGEIISNLLYPKGDTAEKVKTADENIIINEMFEFNMDAIRNMRGFEARAFLNSIPAVLCKNSIELFKEYGSREQTYYPHKQDNILNVFLEELDTIGINVPPGFEEKTDCTYEIILNRKLSLNDGGVSRRLGKDYPYDEVKFNLSEENMFAILDSLQDDKTIVLFGNYHLKNIINRMANKNKKIYVFLSNCLHITYGFIKDIIENSENNRIDNATFFDAKAIKNILVIRINNIIIFQPQINQFIREEAGYGLKFGDNIISGRDKSIMSRTLYWHYGVGANYVSRVKDNFF